jgi:hypothetical protein
VILLAGMSLRIAFAVVLVAAGACGKRKPDRPATPLAHFAQTVDMTCECATVSCFYDVQKTRMEELARIYTDAEKRDPAGQSSADWRAQNKRLNACFEVVQARERAAH